MNKIKEKRINNRFTAAPILMFALTALFSSLCFIFNIQNITFSLILAVIIAAAMEALYEREALLSCGITVTLLALSIIVSRFVYDMSFDEMYFYIISYNKIK